MARRAPPRPDAPKVSQLRDLNPGLRECLWGAMLKALYAGAFLIPDSMGQVMLATTIEAQRRMNGLTDGHLREDGYVDTETWKVAAEMVRKGTKLLVDYAPHTPSPADDDDYGEELG